MGFVIKLLQTKRTLQTTLLLIVVIYNDLETFCNSQGSDTIYKKTKEGYGREDFLQKQTQVLES